MYLAHIVLCVILPHTSIMSFFSFIFYCMLDPVGLMTISVSNREASDQRATLGLRE